MVIMKYVHFVKQSIKLYTYDLSIFLYAYFNKKGGEKHMCLLVYRNVVYLQKNTYKIDISYLCRGELGWLGLEEAFHYMLFHVVNHVKVLTGF